MGRRWSLGLVSALGLCLTGLGACGAEEAPLFDPGTFSGMHEAEIQKDCKESLQCMAQNSLELPDDPVNKCLHDSAAALEMSEERQMNFLRKYGRCSAYVVCDYYTCATSNVTGYGDSQKEKVTHDCQATIDCSLMQGTFTGEEASALQGCVATRTGMLDNYTPTQRSQYEGKYGMCSAMTGCQFTGCFGNGLLQ
jgi:hypothetical protein